MASFAFRALIAGDPFRHGTGITDLEVGAFQGGLRLYSASAADGGLTVFDLVTLQPASLAGQVDATAATGSHGAADIDLTLVGDAPVLAIAGRYDDAFALAQLGPDGAFLGFGGPPAGTSTGALTEIETVVFGASTYVIAGRDSASGLQVFQLSAGYGFRQVAALADTSGLMANTGAMVTFNTGSGHLVLTASSIGQSITSLTIDATGALSVLHSYDSMKRFGIYQPTQLETAEVGGADFLVVGAAGSGNLALFEIMADGALVARDVEWDSLDTRFQGVTALETLEYRGRAFVFAGGRDGGLSLFEIGPNGTLWFLANLVDTSATTLASVSAIEAVEVGGEIQLFVASATETGISQFTLDLGALGNFVAPSGPASTAVGTPGDDLLFGTDARDTLRGMAGNDRIVDGAGLDMIHGGAGADVFVFVRDGSYDRVADYQPGLDRIDLTAFERVHSIASLEIDSTVYGARITVGSEAILLVTTDGSSLSAADFSARDFLF